MCLGPFLILSSSFFVCLICFGVVGGFFFGVVGRGGGGCGGMVLVNCYMGSCPCSLICMLSSCHAETELHSASVSHTQSGSLTPRLHAFCSEGIPYPLR